MNVLTLTQANASLDSEARSEKGVPTWFNRLDSLLPFLFVLFAAPLFLFLAVVTPPFQSPDEPAHFVRAYQIAHGGFTGMRFRVDAAIPDFIRMYDQLPAHPEVHLTTEQESAARKVRWAGKGVDIDFTTSSTAANAPIGYIPQAIAILLGERIGLTVLQTFRLSRLFNGAVALALCAWALALCRRGRFVLFTVLLFPMSLSLISSCSQDAMIISAAAMGSALVSYQIAEWRPANALATIAIATCFFVVVILRPPYIALLFILLLPGLLPTFPRTSSWAFAVGLTGVLIVSTIGWVTGYALAPASSHGDPHAQLLYLLHHPGALPTIFWHSLRRYFVSISAEIIGVLGWLDTRLPLVYYVLAAIALMSSIYAELASPKDWSPWATALIIAAALAAFMSLYIAEYLIWDPVGSDIIEGMQGRYWIPLAIAGGIGLPRLGRLDRCCGVAAAIVPLFPLLTAYYLPLTIIRRYYGQI